MTDLVHSLDRGYSMIWREGRLEEALRNLDDDFEWVATDHPEGEVRRGPGAVIEFFREWMDSWDELVVEWRLHEIDAERVYAEIDMRGRGRESGVPAEMRFAQIWTARDGRWKRMVMNPDVQEARRQAGLSARDAPSSSPESPPP